MAETYGKGRAPFGKYYKPKVAAVDISEDILASESICLVDLVKNIGVDVAYVLYFKKKRVYGAEYGWAIEYDEAWDILITKTPMKSWGGC